jgi:hypothetical protein
MKKTILFSFVTASLTFLVFRFTKIGFFHFFKNKQERNFPFEEGYYNFQNPIKGIDFSKLDSSFFFEKLTTNYREELCKDIAEQQGVKLNYIEQNIVSTRTRTNGLIIFENVLHIVNLQSYPLTIEDSYSLDLENVQISDCYYSNYHQLLYLIGVDSKNQTGGIWCFQPSIHEMIRIKSWELDASLSDEPISIGLGPKDNNIYVLTKDKVLHVLDNEANEIKSIEYPVASQSVKIRFQENGDLQTVVNKELMCTPWVKLYQKKR